VLPLVVPGLPPVVPLLPPVLPEELAPPLELVEPVAVPELDGTSPVDSVEVLEPPATLDKQPPHPSVARTAAILTEPIGATVYHGIGNL
jgi:hypothetical protein